MNCIACSAKLKKSASFCPSCGAKVEQDAQSAPPTDVSSRLFGVFAIILLIASLLIANFLGNIPGTGATKVGGVIGYAASMPVLAVIIASIARIFRARWRYTFLVSCFVLEIIQCYGGYAIRRETVAATDSAHTAAIHLRALMNRPSIGTTAEPVSTSTAATAIDVGTAQQLQQVLTKLNEIAQGEIVAQNALSNREKTLGLGEALQPDKLVERSGVKHARETLAELSEIINEYQANYDLSSQKCKAILAGLPEGTFKKSAQEAFDSGQSESDDKFTSYIAARKGAVSTLNAMVDIFDQTNGRNYVQNGEIHLPPPFDEQYNALVARLKIQLQSERDARLAIDQSRQHAMSLLGQVVTMTSQQ